MSSLENVSKRIAAHASVKDENFGFDPATITLIVSLIINLVRLWWSCRGKKSAINQIKNPSFLFKLFLKREIRKNLTGKRRAYLYDAFMDVAPTITQNELLDITQEIESRIIK